MTLMTHDATLGVTEDETEFVLVSGLYHKDQCKRIPGMRVHDGTEWRAPVGWATACAIAKEFPKIVLDQSARDYTRKVHSEFVSIAYRLTTTMAPPTMGPIPRFLGTTKFNQFPFQQAGSEYLRILQRAGLFDPMGTGKTAQAVTALRALEMGHLLSIPDAKGEIVSPYPALVVAPNSVKASWMDEFDLWYPEAQRKNVVNFGNSAKARKQAMADMLDGGDVLVVNWESLHTNSRHAGYGSIKVSRGNRELGLLNQINWNTIIADEAHRAKDPDAKQTRAIWYLRLAAKYRFALTGTPMANSPEDLWALLYFLWPEEFPSKAKFIDRFCIVGYGDWGGIDVLGLDPASRDEFDQVTRHLWRRTPKKIALPYLPDKVYTTRTCEMKPQQARQYKQMVEQMIVEIEETGDVIVATNALAKMTRLLQFASATGTIDPTDGSVALKAPSCKVDALFKILDDIDDDDQVVVFAQSRKLIELCQAEMDKRLKAKKITRKTVRKYAYGMITGNQSTDERHNNVKAFQAGETRVMLCTLAAGGVGITLTAANTMVFLQRSFSIIDNLQAEDRCHRIGSEVHDSINIIDVISEGTLDVHVRMVSQVKEESLEDLLRDKIRQLVLGAEMNPPAQGEAA